MRWRIGDEACALKIIRSKPEQNCLKVGASGKNPSHSLKLATIIDVHELKGYMLQLHREGRLDNDARSDIARRLADLEAFYCRKLG